MSRPAPQDISGYSFDLIVVGAGINGGGIARDAAMRGLRVLMLDKGDISSGTTQWATRLISAGGVVGGVEGFEEFSAYFRLTGGLPDMLAERLLRLYGVRAPDVLDEAGAESSLRIPLISPYAVETGIIGRRASTP